MLCGRFARVCRWGSRTASGMRSIRAQSCLVGPIAKQRSRFRLGFIAMTNSRLVHAVSAAMALGLGALGFAGVASADDPAAVPPALLNTQCSLDQLMAATKVVDPMAYSGIVAKYNSEPGWIQGGVIYHFNLLLQKSPQDRQAEIDTLADVFPEYVALFRTAEPTANAVAAQCSSFPADNPAVWAPSS